MAGLPRSARGGLSPVRRTHTDQINRALELLALVGDAVDALSVEQMAQAVQGAASQAAIAADAQETYEQKIVSQQADDTK